MPAAALIAAAVCPSPGAQAQTIYWTEVAGPYEGIRRARADGTNIQTLILTTEPIGIAIDHTAGKMYWTKAAGPDDRIQRANLDGTGVEDLVTTGLGTPWGIAVDSVGGKVYWTDAALNSMHRANLDGSVVENLITSGLRSPRAIDLDVVEGKMYWAEASGGIRRANLDGSSIETIVTWLGSALTGPSALALDLTNGKVYWARRGFAGMGYGIIRRANLDGSGVEQVLSGELSSPAAIALVLPQCGNRVVETGEECDDGNTESGDGCDESCLFELGACCAPAACSTMTQAFCLHAGGSFFGIDSTCDAPDTDADGLRDECDGCPDDGNKIEPGICGCGLDDSADSDGDGVSDCIDQCPGVDDTIYAPHCTEPIPTVSEWGLVVMTLLLLSGIKIKLGGRQPERI